MQKRILILIAVVFSTWLTLPGQVYRAELPERALLDLIAGETSGKICLETIRDLSVFAKWYGSDDMQKGAEFLAAQAARLGLKNVSLLEFPVDLDSYYFMQKPWNAWNCSEGELRMIEPKRYLVSSFAANKTCVLANSRDTDITAEVVYVEEGTNESDYKGINVAGKIVLAWGRPWQVAQLAIFKYQAAGVLCSWNLNLPGATSNEVYQTNIPPVSEDGSKISKFGFFLSTDQARPILDLLQKGEKVMLQAHVRAEVRLPGIHQGVTAEIPGTDLSEQEIVFTAHLDHPRPGAHDNNSGCAVLLETARSLRSLIDRGLIAPPRRTIRFYWTPHVWGVDMFYAKYPDELKGVIAAINIDCVGLDQQKFSSSFTLVHTPFSCASFLDDITANLMDYLIRCNHNHMGQSAFGSPLYDHDGSRNVFHGREVPYMDYSDHVFFNSGSVGVPAVTFIDLPFGSHHSQNDKFELLDPTQLRRITFLSAAVAYTIAASGPAETYAVADEIYHRGRARLERDALLAGSVMNKALPEELVDCYRVSRNMLSLAVKREVNALNSALVFAENDRNARFHISERTKRIIDMEAVLLDDLTAAYERLCGKFRLETKEPVLNPVETDWADIFPKRRPGLKGTYGILNFPDEKYTFEPYGPMFAFFYTMLNYMDGSQSLLEIVDAVKAESLCSNYPVFSDSEVNRFMEFLQQDGIVEIIKKKR